MIGTRLGRYQIEEELERCVFGTLFRVGVPDLSPTTPVVLVLEPELGSEPSFLTELQRPQPLLFQPGNESLVRMRELLLESDQTALVLDPPGGRSLRRTLLQGPLPPGEVARLLRELLEALGRVHAGGMAHLCLQPENLFLGAGRKLRVYELGLGWFARELLTSRAIPAIIHPRYRPPEFDAGEQNAISDLYGAGIVAFEMLTGRPACPVEASDAAQSWHLSNGVPDLRDLIPSCPGWLAQLIGLLTRSEPSARPSSVEAALRSIEAGPGVGASSAPKAPQPYGGGASKARGPRRLGGPDPWLMTGGGQGTGMSANTIPLDAPARPITTEVDLNEAVPAWVPPAPGSITAPSPADTPQDLVEIAPTVQVEIPSSDKPLLPAETPSATSLPVIPEPAETPRALESAPPETTSPVAEPSAGLAETPAVVAPEPISERPSVDVQPEPLIVPVLPAEIAAPVAAPEAEQSLAEVNEAFDPERSFGEQDHAPDVEQQDEEASDDESPPPPAKRGIVVPLFVGLPILCVVVLVAFFVMKSITGEDPVEQEQPVAVATTSSAGNPQNPPPTAAPPGAAQPVRPAGNATNPPEARPPDPTQKVVEKTSATNPNQIPPPNVVVAERPKPPSSAQPAVAASSGSSPWGATASETASSAGSTGDPWGASASNTSGTLSLSSNPAGASVFINEQLVGQAPISSRELGPGKYDVRVEKAGYRPARRLLEVGPGQRIDLGKVELQFLGNASTSGVVVITSPGVPPGSKVFVDGSLMGSLPVTVQLTEGSHTFKVQAPDGTYFTQKRDTRFDGSGRPLTVELSPR